MNVLKLISSTNACMLVIMPCHHATSACHVIMPHHHAMPSCLYSMDAMCHPVSGATWHLFLPNFPVDLIEQNDNFLIRSPFEVKRTPLESSRRALRSGPIFAEIGGIQNFSFLDPPRSFPYEIIFLIAFTGSQK